MFVACDRHSGSKSWLPENEIYFKSEDDLIKHLQADSSLYTRIDVPHAQGRGKVDGNARVAHKLLVDGKPIGKT
ncbi:hypothetical protein D1231_04005 [Henriciella mobilis]|nr:hypothetical protein D1231_04005 [Henriciella mobilis]